MAHIRPIHVVAKELEATHREEDQETDPQRVAVLRGRCADLYRELRRAALRTATP